MNETRMKAIDENCPAKAALRALSDEINDMHTDKRQYVDLINNQKNQIRALRESAEKQREIAEVEIKRLSNQVEYWESGCDVAYSRWKHSEKVADQSILIMFAVCAVAMFSIGWMLLMLGWAR